MLESRTAMKRQALPRTTATRRGALKRSSSAATDSEVVHEEPAQEPVLAIIAQWKRERPDLDFQPMLVFAALARTYLSITKDIDDLVAEYGLARGMFDVLATLRRSGAPHSLTPKQLAASLLLSGAGMTNRLDRLEHLKLIVRRPQAGDRRSLQIKLTEKGLRLVDRVLPDVLHRQSRASGIGSKNSQELVRLLAMIIDRTNSKGVANA